MKNTGPSNNVVSESEYLRVVAENNFLKEEIKLLKLRIEWFEKQLFGKKSEKRVIDNPHQADLLGAPTTTPEEPAETATVTYQRGTAKKTPRQLCD